MTKTISGTLDTHLNLDTTTVCTCWKVTRVDGQVYGFTDHDADLTVDAVVYDAESGFLRSAISNNAGLSPDTVDVDGFIDASFITRADLLNGVYDYAAVEIFLVNYEDLTMGTLPLRFGWFGEVTLQQSGKFRVELRGLIDLLDNKIGRLYEPECIADLGDSQCSVVIVPDVRRGSTDYALGDRVVVPSVSTATGVELAVTNGGFESLTGWTITATASLKEAGAKLSPYSGTYYMSCDSKTGIAYQDISLTPGLPITTALIDAGAYTIDLRSRVALREWGYLVGSEVEFYDGGMALINGGADDIIVANKRYPEREWTELKVVGVVPPLARTARIVMRWDFDPLQLATGEASTPGWDNVTLNMRETALDDVTQDEFGNIEFVVTTAGTSLATVPTMDYTLTNTTADGTVVWTASAPRYVFSDVVATVASTTAFTITTATVPDNQYRYGICEFIDGANAGARIEIKSWTLTGASVVLELPTKFAIGIGDKVKIVVGCDKSRGAEFGCEFFENILNFRAFPDMPGTGEYFKIGGVA